MRIPLHPKPSLLLMLGILIVFLPLIGHASPLNWEPYFKAGFGYYKQNDFVINSIWSGYYQGIQAGTTFYKKKSGRYLFWDVHLGYWGSNRWKIGQEQLAYKQRTFFYLPLNFSFHFLTPTTDKKHFHIGLGIATQFEYRFSSESIAVRNELIQKDLNNALGIRYLFSINTPHDRFSLIFTHDILPMFLGRTVQYQSNNSNDRTIEKNLGLFSILESSFRFHPTQFLLFDLTYQFHLISTIHLGDQWFDVSGFLERWHRLNFGVSLFF